MKFILVIIFFIFSAIILSLVCYYAYIGKIFDNTFNMIMFYIIMLIMIFSLLLSAIYLIVMSRDISF
jgi:hypothetical protein